MAVTVALVVWVAASIVYHKYIERWPDEELNEVVFDIFRHIGGNFQDVTYFERKVVLSNSVAECYDIYVLNASRTWQTCRIENGVLFNFHSLNNYGLRGDEGDALNCASEALSQLPNILQSDKEPSNYPEGNSTITIIRIKDSKNRRYGINLSHPDNTIMWADHWHIQKWIGISNDAPKVVDAFCQRMIQPDASYSDMRMSAFKLLRQSDAGYETLQQACWMNILNAMRRPQTIRTALALPDIRNYPAYLRAIPLMTEADITAAKDIPLMDLEKTRKNVHHAVRAPYIVLPIPPKRSPFPTLKNFTPGDKVKVNYEGGSFLIETFVNGDIEKNNGKGK